MPLLHTLSIVLFALVSLSASAQYSTPGTGVSWTLDSLVTHSGGTVLHTDLAYLVIDDLTISEGDSLFIPGDQHLQVSPARLLSFAGYLDMGAIGQPSSIAPTDPDNTFGGIRFEGTAQALIRDVEFNYGGGIKVITPDFYIQDCLFTANQNIATNSAALEFFEGAPFVIDCTFLSNLGAAISSPANIACAPQIIGCTFVGNNSENTNRPTINLGPSGSQYVTVISECFISGSPVNTLVGGISLSSIFGDESMAIIESNQIINHRYGIAVSGGATTVEIRDNIIEFNIVQNEPFQGGSGINLNGTSTCSALIEGNILRSNLWGITVQGDFQVDLGSPDVSGGSLGYNTFSENGNGGQTYALFNNTAHPISARNNCWIEDAASLPADVENVISHETDDATLGLVDYSEFLCGTPSSLGELDAATVILYPSPSQDDIQLSGLKADQVYQLAVTSITGELVLSLSRYELSQPIDISSLAPGTYILQVQHGDGLINKRFVKQ